MEQDVHTNHPIKNMILIFEGCEKKLNLAEELKEKFQFKLAREELDKVDLLLYELKMQLNPNMEDKEVYENSFELYDYMQREVEKMKNTYDFKEKNTLIKILNDFIEAYKGVLKNA